MKKKYFFGIVAMLMVIALALTGCGQQGEQNAGATGSESQGDNDSSGEVIVTEPEEDDDVIGPSQDKTPVKNADGKYVYIITVDGVQTEIATCVNVWDYITSDTPYDRVDFKRMSGDLGWEELPTKFGSAIYHRSDGSYVTIGITNTGSEYNLPTGENRVYQYGVCCYDVDNKPIKFSGFSVSSYTVSNDPYLVGKSNSYVSFEQIVTYALLVDYYRENTTQVISDTVAGGVIVP